MEILLTFFIRSIAAIVLMLLLTRFVGRHMISQMTNYHFIAAITIGSIIGNMVFNININFYHFILSFIIFSSIILLLTILAVKSQRLNRLISGNPTTIIKDGKILEHNMKKIKYTFDMLKQGLRQNGVFNIEEVKYAVLEPNGKLSIMKKPEVQPINKSDLAISPVDSFPVPIELIIEGKIMSDNLKKHNLSHDWLEKEIIKKCATLSDISYGVMGTNGHLYFDFYVDNIE